MPFSALRELKVTKSGGHALRLTSRSFQAEISVLAADLFRFRITRNRDFSKLPSWAVLDREWPSVPLRFTTTSRAASLRTDRGRFTIGLADGHWEVADPTGLVLFSAAAGVTGFRDAEPSVTLRLAESECLFGLGESSGTFNKRGLIREFWNIDVGGHAGTVHAGLRNLYVSVPFGLSLRHGRAAECSGTIPRSRPGTWGKRSSICGR